MILLAFGLVLSVAWLWAGWYYVSVYLGQDNLFYLLPAELGLFLVGFLAPLGILWLLISQSFTRRRLARLERQVSEFANLPPRQRREPSLDVEGERAGGTAAPPKPPRGPAAEAAGATAPQQTASEQPAPKQPASKQPAADSGAGQTEQERPQAQRAPAGPSKPPGNEAAPRLASREADEEVAPFTRRGAGGERKR